MRTTPNHNHAARERCRILKLASGGNRNDYRRDFDVSDVEERRALMESAREHSV